MFPLHTSESTPASSDKLKAKSTETLLTRAVEKQKKSMKQPEPLKKMVSPRFHIIVSFHTHTLLFNPHLSTFPYVEKAQWLIVFNLFWTGWR
jgi:hypothetical protein